MSSSSTDHPWHPMTPQDEYNQTLDSLVHPSGWSNPVPAGKYNLVVIGAGTAGLVTAAVAAGLGARVALVERERMGGDCLNVGCVPSKAILASARSVAAVREASSLGVQHLPEDVEISFSQVMERMRRLRAGIAPDDSASRFRNLGVDVYFGQACFTGADTLAVGGRELRFRRAVIATGARAAAPDIPGLQGVDYLTNESIFSLTELPESMLVIGGGAIGCEMSQAFARLGSRIFLSEPSAHILSREEPDASRVVQNALIRDGVRIFTGAKELSLHRENGRVNFKLRTGDTTESGVVEKVLVAAGRRPNVDGLGLERAGVECDPLHGIVVDDRLRTSNPLIFAAGDVCSRYRFTHAADFMARTVISNALFFGRAKVSRLIIPWATYTDPELAHVGLYPRDAEEQGISLTTLTREFREVHRCILDGRTEGFVRVHLKKGSDRILGATVVGPHAADMISHLTFAMTNRIGLGGIGATIHPYPTHGEAIRQLGDMYRRTRLKPSITALLKRYFSLFRRI